MSSEIKIFCENVKQLRKKVGLSKSEMAKKIRDRRFNADKIRSRYIAATLGLLYPFENP